jgi:hypothetical protein
LRAAAVLSAALIGALGLVPAAAARWSAVARPPGCAAALVSQAPPLIVFPSSEPQVRSGPGALLWDAPRECRGGLGSIGEVLGANLSADDVPERSLPLVAGAGDPTGMVAAVGTAVGQVVVAGSDNAGGVFAEGRAVGKFSNAAPLGGPAAPVSAFSGYLGDAVVVSAVRTKRAGWALAVRLQRHYSDSPLLLRLLPVGAGAPSAVAATVDYRGDILVVWAHDRGIYAREIARASVLEAVHRLASAPPDPELQALISDDGHAIVAWRSQSSPSGDGAQTTIELSIPGPGLAARTPQLIERFRDPPGFPPPSGSLRLTRLSSEAVMMAWTGIDGGRYVVRASPVSLRRGAWAPVTISTPGTSSGAGATPAIGAGSSPVAAAAQGEDAVLADFVAGPRAEALALWTTAPRLPSGGSNLRKRAIFAAKGHYAGHGEAAFEAPETVAPPGPNGAPGAAIDPQTGNALAAWIAAVDGMASSHVAYALRPATPSAAQAAVPQSALACCLGLALPYANIDSSAIRIGTPLAACLK